MKQKHSAIVFALAASGLCLRGVGPPVQRVVVDEQPLAHLGIHIDLMCERLSVSGTDLDKHYRHPLLRSFLNDHRTIRSIMLCGDLYECVGAMPEVNELMQTYPYMTYFCLID